MSSGGAVGIDLGSHGTLLATVKSGGVEVLTNDLSNRSTPTIVSFGEKERFIGEAGFSKLNANFKNTVIASSRFLGLSPEYPRLNDETKWLTCKTIAQGSHLAFEVRYQGETRAFTAEALVAMYFTQLKLICAKAGVAMSDVVISVPSYYLESERRALLDAAAVAEVSCVRLMNETTASALTYGLFRQKELTEEPRMVALVDFGHAKLSVAVVGFTKDKLEVKSHAFERHLGGRDFDWLLMEHFASEFQAKHKINPLQNPRSRLKLSTATEKLRKVLSGNADAHIGVDCLCEDYDFSSTMTRERLEVLCAPLLDRIQQVCEEALAKSGLTQVHSVEIVGGATRMPAVQARLCQAFHVETVSKTMNAEEAVAKGCAVQAAMLSAFFKVKEYGVADRTPYPINISVSYPDDPDHAMDSEMLFTEGNPFPVSKVLSLKKNKPFRMDVFYPFETAGLQKQLARYVIKGPTEAEDYKLKVAIKMTGHGILSLEYAERHDTVLVEEMAVDPPVPTDPAVPEVPPTDPPAKKAPKKKTNKTSVDVDRFHSGLPEATIVQYKDQEKRMKNEDHIARETADRKNELESLVYLWRDRLASGYKDYVPAEARDELLVILNSIEEWIYGDGSDTIKSIYVEKIGNIKEKVDPIDRRFKAFQQLPEAAENLNKVINDAAELARSAHEKYSHISVEDREKVLEQCRTVKAWLDDQLPRVNLAPRYVSPPVEPEEFVKKGIQVRELSTSIMNKPKPAPPKEEKPEEAKKPETEPKPDEQPMAEAQPKSEEPPKAAEESKETEDMEVDA